MGNLEENSYYYVFGLNIMKSIDKYQFTPYIVSASFVENNCLYGVIRNLNKVRFYHGIVPSRKANYIIPVSEPYAYQTGVFKDSLEEALSVAENEWIFRIDEENKHEFMYAVSNSGKYPENVVVQKKPFCDIVEEFFNDQIILDDKNPVYKYFTRIKYK